MHTGSRVSDAVLATQLALREPSAPSFALSAAVSGHSLWEGSRTAELSQSGFTLPFVSAQGAGGRVL